MIFFSSMIVTTILAAHTNRTSFSVVRLSRAWCAALIFIFCCTTTAKAQMPEKCGTPLVIEELMHRKNSQPHSLAVPPILSDFIISPLHKFTIHFTKSGPDSTTEEFVNAVATFADEAYQLEIIELGYPKPAFTFGDSMWHIYLHDFPSGVYGKTTPTDSGSFSTSASGLQRYRCFIEMDNDYPASNYPTHGLDAARITVFHEFHHVVQFSDYGIDLSSDPHKDIYIRFQEMTSTWMETRGTPDVLDYIYYMPNYFKKIDLTFPLATSDFGYSEAVWLYYLAKKFGDDIVRKTWERFSDVDNDLLLSFDKTLNLYNSDFCTEYKRFGTQLFFTGRRDKRTTLFANANLFPVDQLKTFFVPIGKPTLFPQLLPASLNIYYTGEGRDTSVMTVSRSIDRSFNSDATIKFANLSTKENTYQFPNTFCDTIAGFTTTDAIVFPQPYILTDDPQRQPLLITASNSGKKPASPPDVRIYSLDMTLVRHISRSAEAFGGSWYLGWDGTDDVGKLVPSGIYFYSILADGEEKSGKVVVVRK